MKDIRVRELVIEVREIQLAEVHQAARKPGSYDVSERARSNLPPEHSA